MDEQAKEQPKKSSCGKIFGCVLLILVLLFALGYGGWYLYKKYVTKETVSSKDYVIKDAKVDESKKVTKIISTAGGVMQTESAEGTLYTLTIPKETLNMSVEVTMTPLTENPIDNYGKSTDLGVALTGEFYFIRPIYLTVQPNTKKPTEKVASDYCTVGSRIYDPEYCAGFAGIPFGGGIAPGEAMVYSSTKRDEILLTPTVYTGMKNTYNAMLWSPGNYFYDKIDKSKATSLAKATYSSSHDYVNETEVLTHLVALGGDLTPYKEEIASFDRAKGDYPREIIKGAILGLAIDDQEVVKQRNQEFYDRIKQKFGDVRSTFIPWPRYAATYRQILAMNRKEYKDYKISSIDFLNKALAIQDWEDVAGSSSGSDNYGQTLPNYEGDNGVDYGNDNGGETSWQDILNSIFPPSDSGSGNLQDWSNVERNDQLGRDTDDIMEAGTSGFCKS